MPKAKIRGIYATALTRLLLDNGFKIVQPSPVIRERFNLPEDNCQPDLEINDRFDKQGINVTGDPALIENLASILFNVLDDVVIRRRIPMFTSPFSDENTANLNSIISETLKEAEGLGQRKMYIDVEFPFESKKKLDEIRGMVMPTLKGHHYYKACGGKIASMVEMAERLLENGCPLNEVERLFKETVVQEYPHEGSRINIEHVKINGRKFHLGEARVIMFDEGEQRIKLLRVFSAPGIYDGLKIRKEPGDYAITNMKIGEWSFKTSYFSRDGVYKGTYININTPIELYPTKVKYIDLEVDICMWPDGKIQQIDIEKLDEKVRWGYVSEKLKQMVSEKIEDILNFISPNLEKETLIDNDLE